MMMGGSSVLSSALLKSSEMSVSCRGVVVARGGVGRSWRIVPMAAMTSNTVVRILVLSVEGGKLDAQGINRKLQGAYKGTD